MFTSLTMCTKLVRDGTYSKGELFLVKISFRPLGYMKHQFCNVTPYNEKDFLLVQKRAIDYRSFSVAD